MAITRAKKGEILDKLSKMLKSAKSLVFVNFRGVKVSDATSMRRVLESEKVSYTVAKKTLVKKALEGEKFLGTTPALDGELAIAWGEDSIAPARGVYAFQKKLAGSLKILGGVFEGRFMNALEMEEIAKIPSIEVLRGKFVNIINSPIQRFAVALAEIAKSKN